MNRPRPGGYVRDDQFKAGEFSGVGSPWISKTWRWDFTHGSDGLDFQIDPEMDAPFESDRMVPRMGIRHVITESTYQHGFPVALQ